MSSDHFQSNFDRAKGCTYGIRQADGGGRRQVNSTLKLDYAQLKSILDEKNLTNGQSKHLESPFPVA